MINRNYPYRKTVVKYLFCGIDFILDMLLKKEKTVPSDLKNILLVKPDHLGDVLLLTSVLKPLKKTYPYSNVDLVLGSWSNQILNNNPYIRTIYNVDHYKHNRSKISLIQKILLFSKTYINTVKCIRKVKYDITLNFRSYGANLVTLQYLSLSNFNIGFASSGFSPLLDLEVELTKGKHEVEYFLDIIKEISIYKKIDDLKSEVFPSNDDRVFVDSIIKENKLCDFIIIHPGSGDKKKIKNYQFWQLIINKRKKSIVFCGTNDEKYLVENLMNENTIDLMGKFSISQLLEFYKKADFIYCVDSLSGHISSIGDTKTIAFYSDFTDTKRWKPIGKNVEVIKNHKKYLEELI